jgi:hypothetical protein
VAQFGRDVLQDVVEKLIGQFAECLEKEIMGENAREEPAAASTNGPVESFGEKQPRHGTIQQDREVEPLNPAEASQDAVIRRASSVAGPASVRSRSARLFEGLSNRFATFSWRL